MTDLSRAPIARIMFTQPQRMGDNTSQFATASKVRIEPLPCGGVLLRPLKGNAWYELADIEPGGSEKRKLWYVVKVEREGIASRSYEVGEDGEAMPSPAFVQRLAQHIVAAGAGTAVEGAVLSAPKSVVDAAADDPNAAETLLHGAGNGATLGIPGPVGYVPVVGVVKQRKRGERP